MRFTRVRILLFFIFSCSLCSSSYMIRRVTCFLWRSNKLGSSKNFRWWRVYILRKRMESNYVHTCTVFFFSFSFFSLLRLVREAFYRKQCPYSQNFSQSECFLIGQPFGHPPLMVAIVVITRQPPQRRLIVDGTYARAFFFFLISLQGPTSQSSYFVNALSIGRLPWLRMRQISR